MRLPPLGAFRVFDAAARTQSFVQAARQLHVTHGAVSRQIRLLEEDLGVALFERRNRAVFLTAAGRALHRTTALVFEQLEEAVGRIRQHTHDDVLTLSCEPTLAMKWLIPRLPAFHQAHPDVRLHLFAAGGPVDFQKSGVDLALRRDDFKWGADVRAQPICDEWVGPVCTQSYAQKQEGIALLHTQSRPSAWKTWQSVTGRELAGSVPVEYEHFYFCIQAAMAGMGVALSSFLMVQDELARAQLVAPHGFVRDGSKYCLLFPSALTDDPRCQAFARWVTQEMKACEADMLARQKADT